MIDILFVTVPFTITPGPSLAPALLQACVEQKGYSAKSWDMSAEFNFSNGDHEYYNSVTSWLCHPELSITINEFNWYNNIVAEYAARIINDFRPTAIGISLLSFYSQRFVEDLCYHLRLISDIRIIVGGGGVDVFQSQFNRRWYDLMLESKLIDNVILKEGEHAIVELLSDPSRKIIDAPALTNSELNSLPIPNYSNYNFSFYNKSSRGYGYRFNDDVEENITFSITASKGCVRDCNFCDVGKIWNKFKFRSGESVANEIIELHSKYNAIFFSFTDSLLNGGLKPFNELNEILSQKLPNIIKYEGQFICRSEKDMPEKYFANMARAGCYNVNIGLESGSEAVRKHMGKGSSDADVEYTTQMLIKYNIKQSWNIVAGYPTETDKDWDDTIALIKKWVPNSNGLITVLPVDTFQVLEGVPMTTEEILMREFNFELPVVKGYNSFAWVSAANLKNTFPVRVNRFIELCNLCLTFTTNEMLRAKINTQINRVTKQLKWYYESNPKKVFSITTA